MILLRNNNLNLFIVLLKQAREFILEHFYKSTFSIWMVRDENRRATMCLMQNIVMGKLACDNKISDCVIEQSLAWACANCKHSNFIVFKSEKKDKIVIF